MRDIIIRNEPFIEDIDTTVNLILMCSIGDIGSTLLRELSSVDKIFGTQEQKDTILSLGENLQKKTKDILDITYFGFLSYKTQNFIMKHLSHGAQGILEITIDGDSQSSYGSNKNPIITIKGIDNENEIIDITTTIYNSTDIKDICQNLSDFHYLGLGLKGGTLESIEVNRPKYKRRIKSNKKGEETTLRIRSKDTIIYPIPVESQEQE